MTTTAQPSQTNVTPAAPGMGWEVVVPLIVQYGLPLAESLWTKWQRGGAPTLEDWQELRTLANQNAQGKMLSALQRAGIDPASESGKALLALAA